MGEENYRRCRRTHCKRGHALTPENTIVQKKLSKWGTEHHQCRECYQAANRAWWKANPEKCRKKKKKAAKAGNGLTKDASGLVLAV